MNSNNVSTSSSVTDGRDRPLNDDTKQAVNGSEAAAIDLEGNDANKAHNGDEAETSSLERSYEFLAESSKQRHIRVMGSRSPDNTHDPSRVEEEVSENKTEGREDTESQKNVSENTPPRITKSGSFLSKLTSSTSSYDNKETTPSTEKSGQNSSFTNLPSSFASLISSVSFSSGFRGNGGGSSATGAGASGDSNPNGVGSRKSSFEQTTSKLTIETASASTGISTISETREQILSKKASIERKNLINLTKLIVKDLISSSLTVGRTIDDHYQCAIHLNNYFTLLDRVLKHGLKQQNILSNRSASLWNALDNLPKYLTDKRLTSETVRSLAHTKTPDGRIKAWLRIAMMQKKLPEYFNELLANKNVLLKDIYHDFAFMINDEAQVFAGLIIGVNVIDCNFFVKDDNFDMMDEVIDLHPYLRAANSYDEDDPVELAKQNLSGEEGQLGNMTAVLDQKNYLEERSLHLESTIKGLRNKIKLLEEHNSRLEMDAKVNEVRIQKFQSGMKSESPTNEKLLSGGFPIPDALRSLMTPSTDSSKLATAPTMASDEAKKPSNLLVTTSSDQTRAPESVPEQAAHGSELLSESTIESNTSEQQQQRLVADLEEAQRLVTDRGKELVSLRERVGILETSYRGALEKIRVLERDLEVQTTINTDKEATIKLYEKDLRDKQKQIESMKVSLSDATRMNSELNERMNDTSAKLKDRLNTVTSLQASLDKWKLENKTLATRYQDKLTALKTATTQLEQSLKTIAELKKYNEKINDELKKERECGQSSSITVEEQTGKINELTNRLNALQGELRELRPYKERVEELNKRCQDYEQSLEEIGYQLRESRLEVESLKENSSVFLDSQWMDSKQVKECALCQQSFSVTRRKHHCRLCGNVFCQTCSDNKMELASSSKPARVCDTCHAFLLAKFVKSSTN